MSLLTPAQGKTIVAPGRKFLKEFPGPAIVGRKSADVGDAYDIKVSSFTFGLINLSTQAAWQSALGITGSNPTRFAYERASNGAPDLSSMTVYNSGTAGTFNQTQNTYDIFIEAKDDGGSDQTKGLGMALPNNTFEVIIKAIISGADYNYSRAGLAVRESSGGKIVAFTRDMRSGQDDNVFASARLDNYTTFNAAIQTPIRVAYENPQWMKMSCDGTDLSFYFSHTGKDTDWVLFGTEALATFIGTGIDQVFVSFNPGNNAAGTIYSTLIHWELNDT